jgi:hypothetical protein
MAIRRLTPRRIGIVPARLTAGATLAHFPAIMEDTFNGEEMQQNQKPTTLLRIGTITAVAGGIAAVIGLIIGSQPHVWALYALPFLVLGCYVLLAGLAVVVLHYVVRWINS